MCLCVHVNSHLRERNVMLHLCLSALICLSGRSGERSGPSVRSAKQLVNPPPFIEMRNSFFFLILIVFIVKHSLLRRLHAPVFRLRSRRQFFFFLSQPEAGFFSV